MLKAQIPQIFSEQIWLVHWKQYLLDKDTFHYHQIREQSLILTPWLEF